LEMKRILHFAQDDKIWFKVTRFLKSTLDSF